MRSNGESTDVFCANDNVVFLGKACIQAAPLTVVGNLVNGDPVRTVVPQAICRQANVIWAALLLLLE